MPTTNTAAAASRPSAPAPAAADSAIAESSALSLVLAMSSLLHERRAITNSADDRDAERGDAHHDRGGECEPTERGDVLWIGEPRDPRIAPRRDSDDPPRGRLELRRERARGQVVFVCFFVVFVV